MSVTIVCATEHESVTISLDPEEVKALRALLEDQEQEIKAKPGWRIRPFLKRKQAVIERLYPALR